MTERTLWTLRNALRGRVYRLDGTVALVDSIAERPQQLPDDVRGAMREFVIAALGYLSENCGPPMFGPLPIPRLVRQHQELFRSELPEQWVRCPRPQDIRSAIRSLPAYERLREALMNDPSLAAQIDNLVGSPFHQSRVDFDLALEGRLVAPMIEHTRNYEFVESLFASLVEPLVAALFSPTVERTQLVPLQGFVGLLGEFELGDGAVVRPLSDEELGMLNDWGVLPGAHSGFTIRLARSDQWCVAQTCGLPKRVGTRAPGVGLPTVPDTDDSADRLVCALLLTGPGPVSRGPLVAFDSPNPLHFGVGGSTQVRALSRPAPGRLPFTLHEGNLASLRDCYTLLGHARVQSHKPLRLALRRFCDAALRANNEDSVIDLMIAAEALFLSDIQDDRGELGLRLAMRAALFVQLEGVEPRRINGFMKRAYGARSSIVHGSEIGALRSLAGLRVDLATFVVDLELVMRTALKRVVEMTASTGWRSDHWGALVNAALDKWSTET